MSTAGSAFGWVGMGGFVTSNPGAVFDPTGSGVLRVFVRGGDSGVWSQTLASPTAPAAWTSLGGVVFSRAVPVNDGNRTWVYAVGGGGTLYVAQAAPVASGWAAIGGTLNSDPAAVTLP